MSQLPKVRVDLARLREDREMQPRSDRSGRARPTRNSKPVMFAISAAIPYTCIPTRPRSRRRSPAPGLSLGGASCSAGHDGEPERRARARVHAPPTRPAISPSGYASVVTTTCGVAVEEPAGRAVGQHAAHDLRAGDRSLGRVPGQTSRRRRCPRG